MSPPDLTELAIDGVRTLHSLSKRIPITGGILANSLQSAVKCRTPMMK